MISPTPQIVPPPHEDMPEDVKSLYIEAAAVMPMSPRSAAVLIRVALQALLKHISNPTGKLHYDIGNLVKEGYDHDVILAFDLVRLIGDDGAHPDQLMIGQQANEADALFFLLNFIAGSHYEKLRAVKRLKEMGAEIPLATQGHIDDRNRGYAPKPPG